MLVTLWAQPELTNTEATNIDAANERQAWREALEIWTDDAVVFGGLTLAVDLPITEGGTGASTAGGALTNLGVSAFGQTLIDDATAAAAATTLGLGTGDSPTFTGGTYTGNLFVGGKLNVGSGAADDGHIVNFVSEEDVATEVMLHLEWNSPTPLAGDSNALMFSMYDSALNETEYSRFRSVIEDPTDGSEDGAMTVDVLNNGVLEQAVLFSHDEIIMNDNGGDRNFIVKDNTTAEVLRITGGTGSIAMDTDTLFVDSANNQVGVGTTSPIAGSKITTRSGSGNQYISRFIGENASYAGFSVVASNAGADPFIQFGAGSDTAANFTFIQDTTTAFSIRGGNAVGPQLVTVSSAGAVTITDDLTVDTDTLFVDASTNRVGVGDSSPSEALEVANGSVLISQADAQLKFAPRSAQNITQYIDTDVSDLLYIGDTSAGKSILFGGGYAGGMRVDAGGLTIGTGNNIEFDSNSGTWDGATIAGAQTFSNDATISSKLILDTNGGSGTEGIIAIDDGYGTPTLIQQTGGDIITFTDGNDNGSHDAYETIYLNYSLGGGVLGLGGTDAYNPVVSVSTNSLYMGSTPQIYGAFEVADQVELTYQSVDSDSSAMNHELVRDFSSVWGNVYKYNSGETDTSNKLSTVSSGDRYFNFSCYTGTSAGDGQWTTFQAPTFGINYGSGGKGQLRDNFSYKFKFDSNTVTNTDVDLWLIRGKTANATLPAASDVCFALKFEGEENLMIAVYDGVTAHTTTIDVSTIDAGFTNLASQQEFIWTWNGSIAKVYGRYRKPVGSGGNDWSAWYTIGSLTPSGMASSLTNLSYAGLHFLQHTPVTCTAYTKNYIIWDLEHTTHVISPN